MNRAQAVSPRQAIPELINCGTVPDFIHDGTIPEFIHSGMLHRRIRTPHGQALIASVLLIGSVTAYRVASAEPRAVNVCVHGRVSTVQSRKL